MLAFGWPGTSARSDPLVVYVGIIALARASARSSSRSSSRASGDASRRLTSCLGCAASVRIAVMRRTACFRAPLAAVGAIAAGCGQEQEQTATPETSRLDADGDRDDGDRDHRDRHDRDETTDTRRPRRDGTATTRPSRATRRRQGGFAGASACGSCHTLADAGSSGSIGPNLDESMPDYELVLDRVTNGQAPCRRSPPRSPSSRSPTSPCTCRRSPAVGLSTLPP